MPAPASGDPLIGQVVDDRYRICRLIGRGGMGVVYEAEATRLGKRLCAIKVLLPEYTRNENAVARFAREAQVAARVKHPNVVEIFDTGTTRDGLGYIAMELLSGESLDRTLRREGTLPWPRVQRILLQICRALAAAHAQGIVHRDMKPENCFVCSRDDEAEFIKVLDFGIAKLTDPDAGPEAGRLTATNSVIGTYSYMAYEQICGEETDHRVDVWATGVILYELLTGQLPFRGNNQGQIWRAISEYDPAPMRHIAPLAGIPEAIEAVVRQALARPLASRYPSIEALARAVASVQGDGSVRAVTGKLAPVSDIDATAATIGVAATPAMNDPRLSQRTAPLHPHELIELAPGDVDDTDETVVRTALSPVTAPAFRTELAPVRPEAMQDAGSAAAAALALPRRGSRRGAVLLAGLGLSAATLAVMLSQGTSEPETPATPELSIIESPMPSSSTASTETAPPDAVPTTPPPAPAPAPAPAPEPTVAPPPEPVTPPKASPRRVTKPAAKKVEESFSVQASNSLKALARSKKIGDCFTTNSVTAPMTLDRIQITAAGAVHIDVPDHKQGTGLARCIERAFKAWPFPKGNAGDQPFVTKSYRLSPP